MKYNLRAVLGTAVIALVMAATGCGSLANNAAGLERNADGVARERVERVGVNESGRAARGYRRGMNHRGSQRHLRRANERAGTARRGINRVGAENRYLRHEDLNLRNGRFLGDGVNPATHAAYTNENVNRNANPQHVNNRNVYGTIQNESAVRDLAHRTYTNDVVGTDGVVHNQTPYASRDRNMPGNRSYTASRSGNQNTNRPSNRTTLNTNPTTNRINAGVVNDGTEVTIS